MSTHDDDPIATYLAFLEQHFPGAATLPADLSVLMDILEDELHVFSGDHPLAECPYRLIFEVWTATARLLFERNLEFVARLDRIQAQHMEDMPLFLLKENYDALQDAHAALQLEHADLEAAYFVLQRRGPKEE